jgi:hypothetical protein
VEVDPDEEAQNEVFICPEESMDSFNNSKVQYSPVLQIRIRDPVLF